MAEREGFEPPIRLPVCRISSAVHSTTLPPLLRGRDEKSSWCRRSHNRRASPKQAPRGLERQPKGSRTSGQFNAQLLQERRHSPLDQSCRGPMLTVHHLRRSQSERIVWLCEELGLDYVLKSSPRAPVTMLAPPESRALHPMGTAPVITEGDLVLAESGAIVDYIIARYGNGRLARPPGHPDFAQYLFWFHYANGTLQLQMMRNFAMRRASVAEDNPVRRLAAERLERNLNLVEARLGVADYLAGPELTAADIMAVFSLTTMRSFFPLDFTPYAHTLAYLARIGEREAYRRAMKKGDPELTPLLAARV